MNKQGFNILSLFKWLLKFSLLLGIVFSMIAVPFVSSKLGIAIGNLTTLNGRECVMFNFEESVYPCYEMSSSVESSNNAYVLFERERPISAVALGDEGKIFYDLFKGINPVTIIFTAVILTLIIFILLIQFLLPIIILLIILNIIFKLANSKNANATKFNTVIKNKYRNNKQSVVSDYYSQKTKLKALDDFQNNMYNKSLNEKKKIENTEKLIEAEKIKKKQGGLLAWIFSGSNNEYDDIEEFYKSKRRHN